VLSKDPKINWAHAISFGRFMQSPVARGRHFFQRAEMTIEVREVAEARLEIDLGDGPIGIEW
jgi:hypothetical protein